jgi:ASC-1-like (ASCH) protein
MEIVSIKFAPKLIALIKDRKKTLTYRLGNKFDALSVGDIVNIADNTGENFAEVQIIEKSKTIFEDIPLNRVGHEVYSSEEEKTVLFESYYQRKVDLKEPVIVLGFKVIRFL